MVARDSLSADVAQLSTNLIEKEKEVKAVESASAYSTRSLAGKLAAAQAQAEELSSHYKVTGMSLNHEVSLLRGASGDWNRS